MKELHRLKKDKRPAVRAVALHLDVDALGELKQEDERAAGFERNPAGGYGRRGTPKRADVREAFESREAWIRPGRRRDRRQPSR